ncbi:response regulator [bacterium]|nr:response regulator [bacterium]
MSPGPTPRATVLIADDEAGLRTLMAEVLAEQGYVVQTAANGEETLRQIRQQKPDLLLLDLRMPGQSGLEVCRAVRADPATADLPIIVVTGLETRTALEESIIAGADDFLAKPLDTLELSVRVRSLLRVGNIQDAERRLEAYVRTLQRMRDHVRPPPPVPPRR